MSALASFGVLVACALGSLLTAAVYLWINRPRTTVPGPPTIPILGNLLFFRKLPVVVDKFKELQRVYGNVFRLYAGPTLVVMVTEAEDAQRVLASSKMRARGPYVTKALNRFGGNGLITSSGEVWKTHRKIIEPCFHSEVLKRFTDAYNEGTEYICDYLKEADGSQVQLYTPLCGLAVRVLTASAFGTSFDEMATDKDAADEISKSFMDIFDFIQVFLFRPWRRSEIFIWTTKAGRRLLRHMTFLSNLVKRCIAYKRLNKDNTSLTKRKALMDTLMGTEIQMTDEEIYDQIRTFLIAGSDTTACTMGYALVLLGLYPEWQDMAQKELDAVYGNGEDYLRPSTPEDLAQLPIIESIIKESLRLYPTAPLLPVLVSEDTPLGGGRYMVPRGTHVVVTLPLLHRQPDAFPDPEKFDPSRFLESGSPERHRCAYLPFGVGARRCVGDRFAMLEMKTVLAAVLRQFRVYPCCTRQQLDQCGISAAVVPLNDFKVRCIPRTSLPTHQEK